MQNERNCIVYPPQPSNLLHLLFTKFEIVIFHPPPDSFLPLKSNKKKELSKPTRWYEVHSNLAQVSNDQQKADDITWNGMSGEEQLLVYNRTFFFLIVSFNEKRSLETHDLLKKKRKEKEARKTFKSSRRTFDLIKLTFNRNNELKPYKL